jgi:carbonic anhydrase
MRRSTQMGGSKMKISAIIFSLAVFLGTSAFAYEVDEAKIKTPQDALNALIEGNERFVSGNTLNQDFKKQIEKTAGGQAPYAAVLSCLDSRVPPEILFDQGIGDLFVGRVAGNIEDIHMIGSFEFAKVVVGTKILVVMGHTSCGAVKGACADVKLDNLTHLLSEIRPAVELVETRHPNTDVCADPHVDEIAEENVIRTIKDIRAKSQAITDLEEKGDLIVVGAMYDVSTGKVRFLEI